MQMLVSLYNILKQKSCFLSTSFTLLKKVECVKQGKTKRNIFCRLRIEQRILDPTTNDSYFDILNQICLFLNRKLLL